MKKYARYLSFFLIATQSVTAELVLIDPDNFAEEADLTAANPYVELRVAGEDNLPMDLLVVTANDSGEKATPTGNKLFGHSNIGFWPSSRRFYANFPQKTDYVSIQFTGGSTLTEEQGILLAYDENGTLLTSTFTEKLLNGQFATMSISRQTSDIAKIISYTKSGSFGILDNFRFSAYPEIEVDDSGDNPLTSGVGQVAFGNTALGVPISQTFTIRNTGPAPLRDITLSTSGDHASDFIPENLGSLTVAPGESTTFSVRFVPSRQGTRTAIVWIGSNDQDENPFEIPVTGEGDFHATQEIAVEDPDGIQVEDGAAELIYDTAVIGTSLQKTVTIHNFGLLDLTNLAVTVSGVNASDFTFSELATTTLASGESTTLTVTFAPSAAGDLSATLHIESNDADENPFDIALSATGQLAPAPQITVLESSIGILEEGSSTLSFGESIIGKTVTKTIVVRNAGTANLTDLTVSILGGGASSYSVGSLAATSIAPLANTKFTISFSPVVTGMRNAVLRIASNDSEASPFDILLEGTGINPIAPEIEVYQGPGSNRNLEDNKSSREFGVAKVGKKGSTMIFLVKNVGNEQLTNVSLKMKGRQAKDFKVVMIPKRTLGAGESSIFKIGFKPRKAKECKAILEVISNDADENPFRIRLKGTGM